MDHKESRVYAEKEGLKESEEFKVFKENEDRLGLKGNEDLRLDARLMRFGEIVNAALFSDEEARRRRLRYSTYSVFSGAHFVLKEVSRW